nr:hypothetical protein [Mycoplasmopsis bovis]
MTNLLPNFVCEPKEFSGSTFLTVTSNELPFFLISEMSALKINLSISAAVAFGLSIFFWVPRYLLVQFLI